MKYGTSNITLHIKTERRSPSVIYMANARPKLIPNQNIRFQKLSLFKHDLTQLFIKPIIVAFKVILKIFITLILAQLRTAIKIMAITSLMFTVGLLTAICVANDLLSVIGKIEVQYSIPRGLLLAIAIVKSENRPYALNIGGKAVVATSKQEDVSIVRFCFDQGLANIDFGTMQINLYWQGKHFKSIEEILTPEFNIRYAVKFLVDLYKQHGTWQKAVRYYHLAKPEHHTEYSHKVLSCLGT